MNNKPAQLKQYCFDKYNKTGNFEWFYALQNAAMFNNGLYGAVLQKELEPYGVKIFIMYVEQKLKGPPYRLSFINNLFKVDKKLLREILSLFPELGPVEPLVNIIAKQLLAAKLEKPAYLNKIEPAKDKNTKFSIHAIAQFYSNPKQLPLFTDENYNIAIANSKDTEIKDKPSNFGVVLNTSQKRVFEGIVKAFSDSNYKGNELIDKKSYYSRTKVMLNKAPYKNIENIPLLKLKQSEIIALSGYSNTLGDTIDVVEAISHLATKQFCFYWNRLAHDDKGRPKKDKKGHFIKEDIMEISTLLRIKEIREGEILKYYEIEPSAAMLDQLATYFLLVPSEWRQEVKNITGKRVSNYTYEFLMWLRLQYEAIRVHNSTRNKNKALRAFKITKSWEDIAYCLKMPESIVKRKKERSYKIREEAYSVAKQLGYLKDYENTGAVDVLYLNEDYFPTPGKLN